MPNALSLVLALSSAILWGSADFVARLAGERIGSRATAFYAQLFSFLLLAPFALRSEVLTRGPLPLGIVGLAFMVGALNAAATTMLYRALERGQVSIVAPIASSFGVVSAVLATAAGERPSLAQALGIVVACLGVVRVSRSEPSAEDSVGRPRGIGMAIGATLTWGVSFFLLTQVVGALGTLIPVVASRISGLVGHAGFTLFGGGSMRSPRGALGLLLVIGLLDTAAYFAYSNSLHGALTSVASVLASLFSAVTVLLAFVFLHERLSRRQWMAIGLILAGVALVSMR